MLISILMLPSMSILISMRMNQDAGSSLVQVLLSSLVG